MHLYRFLAVAGLIFGLSSTASAAPIVVQYGFGPGGTFSLNGSLATNNIQGGLAAVTYASGSSITGGTVGAPVSLQIMQISATGVTLLANPVPGWQIGPVGLSGAPAWGGAWSVMASGVTLNVTGGGTFLQFTGAMGIAGAGGMTVFGLGPFAWTMDNGSGGVLLGGEISRSVVPEPATGMMVLMGLTGLGLYGGRRKLRS